MRDPVMVMGMHKSGTSLVAEMVHRGGTAMYAGEFDASYDDGIQHERPINQTINRLLLGAPREGRHIDWIAPIWTWPLQPFPRAEKEKLRAEAGSGAWGIKDPRTTITYPAWLKEFPGGPRFYVYRCHTEVLQRLLREKEVLTSLQRLRRARACLLAWLFYNEAVLRNCALDEAAKRPWVLLRYDELMGSNELIGRAQKITGVTLCDVRNPDLYRNDGTTFSWRERIYMRCSTVGLHARLRCVYRGLQRRRLHPVE